MPRRRMCASSGLRFGRAAVTFAAASIALLIPTGLLAQLPILGTAGNYAVLEYENNTVSMAGGGVTGPTGLVGTNIVGSIGIGSGSRLSASAGAVNGSVQFADPISAANYQTSGTFQVTGSVSGGVAAVNAALNDATDASQLIAAMPPNQTFGSINVGANRTQTITVHAGVNVIAIGSITLNNATLILSGPANAVVYINVGGPMTVNGGITQTINGNRIHVGVSTSGGLSFGSVLFNFPGSGEKVSLTSNALVQGSILNPAGDSVVGDEVSLSGGEVEGEVIAGKISIVSSSQVIFPHTASLSGSVVCDDNGPVGGALVQLLDGNNSVVESTTTDANGNYAFSPPPSGTYTVAASRAPDFLPATSASFVYQQSGSNIFLPAVQLTDAPVNYIGPPDGSAIGFAVFGASWPAGFGYTPSTGPALQQSDLYNSSLASSSTTYNYVGYIPEFPELGHFGGSGEPTIMVVIYQAFVPTTQYNGATFTNRVGVYDVPQGAGATSSALTPLELTYRFLFSQPFTGPGTAYDWAFIGIASTSGSDAPMSINPLSPIWVGGGAAPPPPPAGTLPAGWMAQGIGQYTLPPFVGTNVTVTGSFENACGDVFPFSICPPMSGLR